MAPGRRRATMRTCAHSGFGPVSLLARVRTASGLPALHAASPAAAAFFDTLAQFYRKAYLRWIDATTRRPDLRAVRIAEVVDLLEAGIKQRPRS